MTWYDPTGHSRGQAGDMSEINARGGNVNSPGSSSSSGSGSSGGNNQPFFTTTDSKHGGTIQIFGTPGNSSTYQYVLSGGGVSWSNNDSIKSVTVQSSATLINNSHIDTVYMYGGTLRNNGTITTVNSRTGNNTIYNSGVIGTISNGANLSVTNTGTIGLISNYGIGSAYITSSGHIEHIVNSSIHSVELKLYSGATGFGVNEYMQKTGDPSSVLIASGVVHVTIGSSDRSSSTVTVTDNAGVNFNFNASSNPGFISNYSFSALLAAKTRAGGFLSDNEIGMLVMWENNYWDAYMPGYVESNAWSEFLFLSDPWLAGYDLDFLIKKYQDLENGARWGGLFAYPYHSAILGKTLDEFFCDALLLGFGHGVASSANRLSKHWAMQNRSALAMKGAGSTTQQLQNIANNVNSQISGRGAVVGTQKHTLFAQNVRALKNPYIKVEQSYLNGKTVNYGTKGSVRVDVIEQLPNGKINVYDFKTGGANLTKNRITQIQNAVNPNNPSSVNVFQIK